MNMYTQDRIIFFNLDGVYLKSFSCVNKLKIIRTHSNLYGRFLPRVYYVHFYSNFIPKHIMVRVI